MEIDKLFPNPIAPRKKESSKWFVAPSKEQATTGRFQPPGDNYGKGFNNPIGHTGNPSPKGPVPQKAKCFPLDPPR